MLKLSSFTPCFILCGFGERISPTSLQQLLTNSQSLFWVLQWTESQGQCSLCSLRAMKQIFPQRLRDCSEAVSYSLVYWYRDVIHLLLKKGTTCYHLIFPICQVKSSLSQLVFLLPLSPTMKHRAKNDDLKLRCLLSYWDAQIHFSSYTVLNKLCCPNLRKRCGFLRFV